jgi:hypothetical protein
MVALNTFSKFSSIARLKNNGCVFGSLPFQSTLIVALEEVVGRLEIKEKF